jgi:hypothetical protein
MTTIPVTAARTLDKRAAASDTIIEADRLAYEAGWITEANNAIHRWCLAANIKEADITQRHFDHACYFCGANVKSAGIIVHSFWQCPERLQVHDRVEDRLREQAQKEGVNIERNRSQRAANDR